MATHILIRRDTAANWTANNPILQSGEFGLETDTRLTKVGNGSTAWINLEYFVAGDGSTVGYIEGIISLKDAGVTNVKLAGGITYNKLALTQLHITDSIGTVALAPIDLLMTDDSGNIAELSQSIVRGTVDGGDNMFSVTPLGLTTNSNAGADYVKALSSGFSTKQDAGDLTSALSPSIVSGHNVVDATKDWSLGRTGLKLPVMTSAERVALTPSVDTGWVVFDSDLAKICYYEAGADKWYSVNSTEI